MVSDNNRIRYTFFLYISSDRNISFNIKCFLQQCKDFSCDKKIFGMDFNTVSVEAVDDHSPAHPDQRRSFRNTAVSCRADIAGQLLPDFSGE